MTLEEALKRYPKAETFKFGDSEWMSADLIALVRAGKKTATCDTLAKYQADPSSMPVVGRQDIALNWDDTPALVIETQKINHWRFDEVPESFSLAEGETKTHAGWVANHRTYFERHGGWSPDMMLLCEEFRMIEDFENR